MENHLSLMIFKIILGLFILSNVPQLIVDMLVENISGVSAHRRENLEKLNQSLIGKNIMDHVQN